MLIHHGKFEMWSALSKFPILFLTVNLNLDIHFRKSSKNSKLGLWNFGLRLYLHVFPNPQRDQKLEFLNFAQVGFLNFFQFMEDIENWDF